MRVIAIDPGYDRIGIAILDKKEDKYIVVHSEFFITDRKETISQRIFSGTERIGEIITIYKPNFFVIEKLFFSKNTKTALSVSEARGSFIFQAMSHNIPVYEYTPNQIKLAVTGNGNATKSDILFFLDKILDVPKRDEKYIDDEIDAIAIALTFMVSNRIEKIYERNT